MNFLARIEALGKELGHTTPTTRKSYRETRADYDRLANEDVERMQREAKQARVNDLMGQAELNPDWTIDTFERDAPDAIAAYEQTRIFTHGHTNKEWRSKAHMLVFHGDYGRGKSHLAGAVAHALIESCEVSVLYRQLSTILDMRAASYDFGSADGSRDHFRALANLLTSVDLLILDEVCVNESTLNKGQQSWLGNLLRQRFASKKNCILITNHTPRALEEALGKFCFESIKEYKPDFVAFKGVSRRD